LTGAPLCGETLAAEARARLLDAGMIEGRRHAVIVIDLPPGAITYWRTPGDGGLAPELDTTGSANLAAAALRFPAPRRFDKGGALAFGYEGRAVFPLALTPSDAGKPIKIEARLDYGVCDALCAPAQARFSLDLAPQGLGESEGRAAALDALRNEPRPTPLGAAGSPAILSVTAQGAGRFAVATRGGRALFVEAPEGWWFDVEGEGPQFTASAAQRPPQGRTAAVTFTLVGDDGAAQTAVRLDADADAP
jgi:DsbC/DsbD-like thiol-disulfide interchange protein